MDKAFQYVKDNGGIDTEASYNYTAKDGKHCLYNASNSGATLKSWVDIPHFSEVVHKQCRNYNKMLHKLVVGPSKSCCYGRTCVGCNRC